MSNEVTSVFLFRDPNNYESWLGAGKAIKQIFGDSEAAYKEWVDWSRASEKFDEVVCAKVWVSFPAGGGVYEPPVICTHQELTEAFSRWENDYREKPEGFYTPEEAAALEVATLSEGRAIALKAYLREVRAGK